jgi:hypothetical protein
MRRIVVAGGAVLVLMSLAGCSGASGGSSSARNPAIAAPAAASRAPVGEAAARGGIAGTGSTRGTTDGGGKLSAPVLDDGAAKIRTAEITVAVAGYQHVAQRADEADDIAARAGGEIDSDDRTTGRYATASVRLRVPPDQLQPVLTALGKLGAEQSRSSSTTDVTERVADVTSRLSSARESIARLRQLYGTATKVADVIAVESELSSREADLESLEAQQRSLAKQTAMASVSLHLETAAAHPTPPRKTPDRGFLGGLRQGWDGFVATAVWVADAVGRVLPFLVLLLVLAFAARLLGLRLPTRVRRGGTPAPGVSGGSA